MLPGVEAARRRRFHRSNLNYGSHDYQLSGTISGSTRRSAFCLYASSSHEYFRVTSNSSVNIINPISQHEAISDESRLDAAAREAKKRLDERLQPQFRRSSETKSQQIRSRSLEDRPTVEADVQTEVARVKKSGCKRFSWLKLSWKSSEQEECVVCLDKLKGRHLRGENLMQLACGHKFHTNCLLPWLEANAHCPCCRMEIPS